EAPEFLLRPIAKRMEIPYWRGTICAYLMNQYLPKPPVVHPFGDKKVDIARKICNELGYDLSHAIAYADSSDDLPLLGEVGKPVVVHPDRRLRREAQRQGWEIIL
ncbi:MAG: HAD family hydrolase, partial [Gammaproteobacteria bacterium]